MIILGCDEFNLLNPGKTVNLLGCRGHFKLINLFLDIKR